MDKRIEKVIEELEKILGLQQFVFHSHTLMEEKSAFGGFDSLLIADWLPPGAHQENEEEPIPEGAVSVSYSLRFQQLRYAMTVGGVSLADPIAAGDQKEEQMLHWFERQTGLSYEKTFTLTNRSQTAMEGTMSFEGIPVSTEGYFSIQWDEDGRLLSAILPTAASESFEKGPFTLTLETIEPLVRQQLTRVRLPIEEESRFADVYAIDEVYIAQDGTMLPFFAEEQSAVHPRLSLQWKAPSARYFDRQAIQPLQRELTIDEAMDFPKQENAPLTSGTIAACIETAIDFLSSELPEESGEWELYRVTEQPGNIEVICRKIGEIAGPLRRKLVLMLSKDTYEVMNYLDSSAMAQLFEGFTQPRIETVTQKEAFELMLSSITLDPAYIYHQSSSSYKLCGLLDSEECVDAVTGELKQLNDL